MALFGWGVSARIDVGTGADRFDRALRRLSSFEVPVAMASFTFDENDPGSVVVIPRALVKVDASGTSFLIGDSDECPLPPPPLCCPMAISATAGSRSGPGWSGTRSRRFGSERWRRSSSPEGSQRDSMGLCPQPGRCPIWPESEPDSHTFLVDGFVGSSPELLVSLASGRVRSISLAGSADPGDPASAGSFGTEKMTREHALAADSVDNALTLVLRPAPAVGENCRHLRGYPAPVDRLPG